MSEVEEIHVDTISHLVANLLGVSPDNFVNSDSVNDICTHVRDLDGDADLAAGYVIGFLVSQYGHPSSNSERDVKFYASMSLAQLSEYLPLAKSTLRTP